MADQADGRYSYTRPWELTSQTLEMQRRLDADVAPNWYPAIVPVPDARDMVPPMYGYRTTELGIADILDGTYSRVQGSHIHDSPLFDQSGQQGSYEATQRPSGAGGMAVT
jgi:hypothetical protein